MSAGQVFPTRVRSFGLGVNNAMSRIGALLSPFMAVALVERGMPGAAEGIIAVCCMLAAIATMRLPLETAGKALLVSVLATLVSWLPSKSSSDVRWGWGVHRCAFMCPGRCYHHVRVPEDGWPNPAGEASHLYTG